MPEKKYNEIETLPNSFHPSCCKIRQCPFLVRKSKAKPKDTFKKILMAKWRIYISHTCCSTSHHPMWGKRWKSLSSISSPTSMHYPSIASSRIF